MEGLVGDRSAFADAATYRFQGARPSCRAFVYVATVIAPENATQRRSSTVPQMQRLRNREDSWYRLRSTEKIRGIDYACLNKFVVSTTRQGKVRGIGYAPADDSWRSTQSSVAAKRGRGTARSCVCLQPNLISCLRRPSTASSVPRQSEPPE